MQKSCQTTAQATLCGWTQTHIVDDREEGRTYNKGFGKIWAELITMSICNSILLLLGQTSSNLAFCCYLHHQFFNCALVPGGRFSNSQTSPSPIRWWQCLNNPTLEYELENYCWSFTDFWGNERNDFNHY